MRLLWTLVKVVFVLCLIVPLSIIALATALGILGALVGLAVMALRLAIVGLIGYGIFRLIATLVGKPSRRDVPRQIAPPTPAAPRDPYYESAMRELDRDIPTS